MMNKKTIKLSIIIILSLLLSTGIFVVADYYELFGSTIEKRLSFAEVRFRTLNKDTGAVVSDVGVRCFQKNNMNACTLKESHQLGIVSVNIPVQRAVKKTLLFKKAEEIYKSIDPKIHIMLGHQDYNNPTVTLLMEDVYSNNVGEQVVQMPPRDWGDSEPEEE
ncbi:MAG: hypothetical protein HND53_10395 [Proteobacteria bacterium]|nr:hypothetical protein [Pseudomonadota bacterium]NOG60900.1 hypothetical protein [Pseudomonadota bacterium]